MSCVLSINSKYLVRYTEQCLWFTIALMMFVMVTLQLYPSFGFCFSLSPSQQDDPLVSRRRSVRHMLVAQATFIVCPRHPVVRHTTRADT